jgi:hypothetical protein
MIQVRVFSDDVQTVVGHHKRQRAESPFFKTQPTLRLPAIEKISRAPFLSEFSKSHRKSHIPQIIICHLISPQIFSSGSLPSVGLVVFRAHSSNP